MTFDWFYSNQTVFYHFQPCGVQIKCFTVGEHASAFHWRMKITIFIDFFPFAFENRSEEAPNFNCFSHTKSTNHLICFLNNDCKWSWMWININIICSTNVSQWKGLVFFACQTIIFSDTNCFIFWWIIRRLISVRFIVQSHPIVSRVNFGRLCSNA